MLVAIVLLLLLTDSEACLFPTACFQGGVTPAECCPMYKDSPCGEKYGRGSCVRSPKVASGMDDKFDFPSSHMLTRCNCSDNCMGDNCGDCMSPFYGDDCKQNTARERRDIREMSGAEVELFKAQLQYCKDLTDPKYCIMKAGDVSRRDTYECVPASYYEVWCHADYYSTQPFMQNGVQNPNINFADGSTNFFTKNRMSIIHLECQMRRCLNDDEFMLPYYDYQNDDECDVCNDQYMGATDEQGTLSKYSVFSSWPMTCGDYQFDQAYCLMPDCLCERSKIIRRIGLSPGAKKPTTTDLQNCMKNQKELDAYPYTSDSESGFRQCIEEIHQRWLNYIGGTMSVRSFACNDPLYAMAMVFVDKIFDRGISFSKMENREWKYPDNTNYGQRPTDYIIPFLKYCTHQSMVREMADVKVYYSIYNGF